MYTSERWKKLRDAAAWASHAIKDAEEHLDRLIARTDGLFDDEAHHRNLALEHARTARAIILWELRKQGWADREAEQAEIEAAWKAIEATPDVWLLPYERTGHTALRECSICRRPHGPEIIHACE